MKKYFYILPLIFLVVACKNEVVDNSKTALLPKKVEVSGYIVPEDRIKQPMVVPFDESKQVKIKAINPIGVPVNLNFFPFHPTPLKMAGIPQIKISGCDSFLLPRTVVVYDSQFVGGVPQVFTAKDMAVKDFNPFSFLFPCFFH